MRYNVDGLTHTKQLLKSLCIVYFVTELGPSEIFCGWAHPYKTMTKVIVHSIFCDGAGSQ